MAPKRKAIQQGTPAKGLTRKEVGQLLGKPRQPADRMAERPTGWHYSRFQGKEWPLLLKNGVPDRYVTDQE